MPAVPIPALLIRRSSRSTVARAASARRRTSASAESSAARKAAEPPMARCRRRRERLSPHHGHALWDPVSSKSSFSETKRSQPMQPGAKNEGASSGTAMLFEAGTRTSNPASSSAQSVAN
jgi:hypothetical protein